MRRVVVPVVLLLALGGLLGGCSSSRDSSSPAAGPVAEAGKADGAAVAGAPAAVDRQVVTTGSVSIVVADPASAARQAAALVESAGGRIDERVEHAASGDQGASARLVLRVPSAHLTDTLEQLKALGHVDQVQLTATDVTDAAQDLDARISALQVSVARLETLMGSATSSADLLALESALSTRQADLEAKQAERAGLAGKVALATITLDLTHQGTAVTHGPSGFWSAIGTGWDALLATLRGVLIAVGVLLPWAVFLGALAAATLWVIRFVRGRRPPAQVTAAPAGAPRPAASFPAYPQPGADGGGGGPRAERNPGDPTP